VSGRIDATRRERIAEALTAARERDGRVAFVGYIEVYCENPRCAVREAEIRVKELDDTTPAALRCPACRRQLKLHHVRTLDEQIREDERDARSSVNAQLYVERERRRLGDPDALVAIPLGAFLDDCLPVRE
jgi:hypothetical protein